MLIRFAPLSFGRGYQKGEVSAGCLVPRFGLVVCFGVFFFSPSFFSSLPKAQSGGGGDAFPRMLGGLEVSPDSGWAGSQTGGSAASALKSPACLFFFFLFFSPHGKLVRKKNNKEVLYFFFGGGGDGRDTAGGRLDVYGGFQQALNRSPGGTKSSPASQAQSPAWRISPRPPGGAVGDAAASYCQCNIFQPIFKWAEGMISRALGPHRPLLPSLLCLFWLFGFFFFLPWV